MKFIKKASFGGRLCQNYSSSRNGNAIFGTYPFSARIIYKVRQKGNRLLHDGKEKAIKRLFLLKAQKKGPRNVTPLSSLQNMSQLLGLDVPTYLNIFPNGEVNASPTIRAIQYI